MTPVVQMFLVLVAVCVIAAIGEMSSGRSPRNDGSGKRRRRRKPFFEKPYDEISYPTPADEHREKKAAAYGEAGEKELFGILRHGLDPDTYEILYDIMLPSGRGDTTQIDFLIVSEFGVFVVEAKNYSGWIFADTKRKVWTQTLPKGIHNTFQNPIRQNFAHLCALESVTGIPRGVMHSMVAFSDRAEFKTPLPPGVCYFSGIVATIQKTRDVLVKASQIPDLVAAILEWDQSITPEQRAAHVANLRARHRPAP